VRLERAGLPAHDVVVKGGSCSPSSRRAAPDRIHLDTPQAACTSGRKVSTDAAARTRPPRPALASNTRATYASQWNRFCAWCEERGGADPLDAGAAQVAAYLAERAETRKLATVQAFRRPRIAAAARSAGRADPTKTPLVADTLRGIARQHAAAPEAAPRLAAALD